MHHYLLFFNLNCNRSKVGGRMIVSFTLYGIQKFVVNYNRCHTILVLCLITAVNKCLLSIHSFAESMIIQMSFIFNLDTTFYVGDVHYFLRLTFKDFLYLWFRWVLIFYCLGLWNRLFLSPFIFMTNINKRNYIVKCVINIILYIK